MLGSIEINKYTQMYATNLKNGDKINIYKYNEMDMHRSKYQQYLH